MFNKEYSLFKIILVNGKEMIVGFNTSQTLTLKSFKKLIAIDKFCIFVNDKKEEEMVNTDSIIYIKGHS